VCIFNAIDVQSPVEPCGGLPIVFGNEGIDVWSYMKTYDSSSSQNEGRPGMAKSLFLVRLLVGAAALSFWTPHLAHSAPVFYNGSGDLDDKKSWAEHVIPTSRDEAVFDVVKSDIFSTGALNFGNIVWNNNTSASIALNAKGITRYLTLSGDVVGEATIKAGGAEGDILLMGENAKSNTLKFGAFKGKGEHQIQVDTERDALLMEEIAKLNTLKLETLKGDGDFQIQLGADGNFNVLNAEATLDMSIVVTGDKSLTKTGEGTLIFGASNTYTGTTTISGGTLVLNGTNTGSAITVNSGGTLAGIGTGATTTINSGGKISPGNSPGILTVGNLTLNGGGTYTWEMADATGSAGTGWDQINATGLLTIGANATSRFTIAITSSGAPSNWNYTTSNQSWEILDYGTISGFNASYFTLNTTAFAGDLTGDSSWAITDTGSALRLTYTFTGTIPTYAGGTGVWSTGFIPAITNSANATFVDAGGTATNDIASATLSSIGSITFDGSNSYTLEANSGSAGFNSA